MLIEFVIEVQLVVNIVGEHFKQVEEPRGESLFPEDFPDIFLIDGGIRSFKVS